MALCLGSFLLLLDVTVVTVALPDMAADLSASFAALQWVLDGYALVLAALLLGAGALADITGRRRAYLAGLAVFALGSLACGLAPNAGLLVAARVGQGAGGAVMFATVTALLNSTYSGRDRGTAFGVWGATSGAASALGPLVGGLLTEHLDWRWVFLVNLPVCVLAGVLARVALTESRRPDGASVDVAGTAAFSVAAGALTYALIRAGDDGWASARTIGTLVLAAAAFAAFLAIERRVPHPLLDLRLFRSGSFSATLAAGAILMASAFAILAYTSVWLQGVLGLGPIGAGIALVPLAVCSFLVSAVAGRTLQGVSPRWTVGAGMLLVGAGALLQAVVDGDSTRLALLPGLAVAGVGVGLAIPTLTAAAMSAVPHERGGMVAGALNTARQLGYALGVAVLGLVFRRAVPAGTELAPGRAAQPVRDAVAAGLHDGYLVAGVAGLAGGLLVLALVRPASVAAPAAAGR